MILSFREDLDATGLSTLSGIGSSRTPPARRQYVQQSYERMDGEAEHGSAISTMRFVQQPKLFFEITPALAYLGEALPF
jgi:hypothetical protein